MSLENTIQLKINNWDRWRGRKDVKMASWFKLSNRLFEDPDLYDFTAEELLAWIYFLSIASQKNSGTITINCLHAERIARLKKEAILDSIEKLQSRQIVSLDDASCLTRLRVTCAVRGRNVDVTPEEKRGEEKRVVRSDFNKLKSSLTTCAEPSSTPSGAILKFETVEQLRAAFDDETRKLWRELYPDETFRARESLKAFAYYRDNPQKTPKKLSGWKRALGSWFERSWIKHVSNLSPNGPNSNKNAPPAIRYPDAGTVLATLPPSGDLRPGGEEAAKRVRDLLNQTGLLKKTTEGES